jgi:Tfp pilus assembly protein FimV
MLDFFNDSRRILALENNQRKIMNDIDKLNESLQKLDGELKATRDAAAQTNAIVAKIGADTGASLAAISEGKTKGHTHAMATRYMIKEFLADLWTKWRVLEGLPVRSRYAEEKLGLVHAELN